MSLMLTLTSIVSAVMASCDKDNDDKDTTKPTIQSQDQAGFVMVPINCDDYHRGDTIHFQYIFEDDVELGSFNIEVHDNSDHHSHSTESDDHDHEGGECNHDHDHEGEEHEHEADEPHWVYNESFAIPAGLKRYEAKVDIPIPEDIAEGDYHFMIRLTDRAGWQQLKALAIIIEE